MAKNWNTPLALYLKKLGLHQSEFALLVERARGYRCTQQQVSSWCSGKTAPSTERHIAAATGGAVTPRDWARWRRSQASKAVAS